MWNEDISVMAPYDPSGFTPSLPCCMSNWFWALVVKIGLLPLSESRGGSSDHGEEGSGKEGFVEEPGQEQTWGDAGTWMEWRSGWWRFKVWGLKAGVSDEGPWSLTPPPPSWRTQGHSVTLFSGWNHWGCIHGGQRTSHPQWNQACGRDCHDVLAFPQCHRPLPDWAHAWGEAQASEWPPHRETTLMAGGLLVQVWWQVVLNSSPGF